MISAAAVAYASYRYYRRDVKGRLGIFERASPVEKVIVLFVESGLVICSIWVQLVTLRLVEAELTHVSGRKPHHQGH